MVAYKILRAILATFCKEPTEIAIFSADSSSRTHPKVSSLVPTSGEKKMALNSTYNSNGR